MATTKKTTGTRKTGTAGTRGRRTGATGATGEDRSGLAGSAQQIWLAGLGALGRAQKEGGKLFDALVREGRGVQKSVRVRADARADEILGEVESRVDDARERTSQAWGWLENSIEQRLQGALRRLNIPSRREVDALARKVDRLDARVPDKPASRTGTKTAGKTSARKAAKKSPAKPRAPRKRAAAAATAETGSGTGS